VKIPKFQNSEKRLSASSCLCFRLLVRRSAWNNSAPTGRIFVKCGTWVKVKAIQLQAWTDPKDSRSLGLPDFKTIGTWKWYGCQP